MALTDGELENLKKIGSEWQKNGMHRVYVNDLMDLYGLKVHCYNTGNISSATLDGEHISNSKASKLRGRLYYAKLYYDVPSGKFGGRDIDQELFDKLVEVIKGRIAEVSANA